MFAIAFDLTVAKVKQHHPKGTSQAYRDIGRELRAMGFERTQGSVYLTDRKDLANLFSAIQALKNLPWFANCVRDVRGFRVEEWSDFTPMVTVKAGVMAQSGVSPARKRQGKQAGFKEEAALYTAASPELVGQFRRFGDFGPAYEVLEIAEKGEALIEVVYSGERVTLPINEIMTDPVAETIP
jgi:virulence-associated protein VapD